jgi:sterol O-acyltransferase
MGLPGDGEQGRGIVRSKPAVHVVPDDDTTVQEFLEKSSHHAGQQQVSAFPPSGVFRDYYVFTHQFSAFDRKNTAATNNPFRGFYTLFWMGVALFVFKISSENWRTYGNPLGTNEIMKTMFHRDGMPPWVSDYCKPLHTDT